MWPEGMIYGAMGFLSGSVPYSYLIPKWAKSIDIRQMSLDANPGAVNAICSAGTSIGLFCLTLDIAKGFLPVFIALRKIPVNAPAFALVLTAPVAGHAFSPLLRFRGGKAIAVSFGVLIAMLGKNFLVFWLAGLYLLFTLLKVKPNERRSVITFACFALAQLVWRQAWAITAGSVLISTIVIYKNSVGALVAPGQQNEGQGRLRYDKSGLEKEVGGAFPPRGGSEAERRNRT